MDTGANTEKTNAHIFSLRELVIFGLAFMTPAAPALIYGDLVKRSGGAPSLVYAVAFFVILFTVQSYGKLSRAFNGPVCLYVRESVNRYAGIVAGWSSGMFYILASALAFSIGAHFASDALPSIPRFVWALSFAAVSGAVLLLGRRATAIMNAAAVYLVTAITAVYILVCVFAAYRGTGIGLVISEIPLQPTGGRLDAILTGGSLACLSFLGFDAIAAISDEARNAKKNVGRAMFIACAVAGILFFLQAYASSLIRPGLFEFTASSVALFDVGNKAGGPPMVYLCIAALIISALSVGTAGQLAACKTIDLLWQSEAPPRMRNMPRLLKGKARGRVGALPCVLLATCAIAAANVAAPAATDGLSASLTDLVQFFGCFCFVLINAAAMIHFYFKKKRRHIFTGLLFPALGFFSSLYLWIHIRPAAFQIGLPALIPCVVWLIPHIFRAVKARMAGTRTQESDGGSTLPETPAEETSDGENPASEPSARECAKPLSSARRTDK
ncbi:MAG: APC family permease [Clostridiales Family XIII bacterium]|jgi:amino acid transporter|nr:APC family permease [Clostridiales Family XIII bacterium]